MNFFLNCSLFPLTSLAELEKEVHNIKSGLRALEAVSLGSVCVTGSSPVCNYALGEGQSQTAC